MKIFKLILIILGGLLVLTCFISFWIEPKLSLWEIAKSIVLPEQKLPIVKMFTREHNEKLIVGSGEDFVLSGPYQSLFNGNYDLTYEIIPSCSNQAVGYMDVVKEKGLVGFGQKDVIVQKEGEVQKETLNFDAVSGFDYEFRLYSYGSCQFEITDGYLIRNQINWKDFAARLRGKR